jgi:multidrug resistance protein, MATE family
LAGLAGARVGEKKQRKQALLNRFLGSLQRIFPLAWPVFIGQIAVLAFSTVDTVLIARYSPLDLAALSVGSAAYLTIFIGLMGVVLAIGPIAGRLFGAGEPLEAGKQLHQAAWLAIALSVLGGAALLMPQPFLRLAHASPEASVKIGSYLQGLCIALPAALLFTVFRGFNTAVSRPKMVMVLQLSGLFIKVPLSIILVFKFDLGATGCAVATAITMWIQCLCAWYVMKHDRFYAPFGLHTKHLCRPHLPSIWRLMRLGIPIGASILIEVTGFTLMTFFINRMGTTAVAGHQLVTNLIAMLYMMPLALGYATSALVAQRLGAQDPVDAKRLSWHGLTLGLLLAGGVGSAVYLAREQVLGWYTSDPTIVQAALPLLAWLVVFHMTDAAQVIVSFVLRAYHVVTLPLAIYALAIWGVGLGGGYLLAFNTTGLSPGEMQGALGFWFAGALGLLVAGAGLCVVLHWVCRQSVDSTHA